MAVDVFVAAFALVRVSYLNCEAYWQETDVYDHRSGT